MSTDKIVTLNRPLVVFDVESTGVEVAVDRIIQISAFKLPAGEIVQGEGEWLAEYINPGIHIPESATAIHGITDEMLKDKPPFKRLAKRIFEFFDGCDIAGYNIRRFDTVLLREEFLRENIDWDPRSVNMVDCFEIFCHFNPRDLQSCFKHYTGLNFEGAHNATADVDATSAILMRMLAMHEDLGGTIETAATIGRKEQQFADFACKIEIRDGEFYYTIGKAKGTKVTDDPGFGKWMLGQNFTQDTKAVVRKILGILI